jgi:hypothetical protein
VAVLIDGCQRWRERRESYRPAGEPFDPRTHEVARLAAAEAKAFVQRHHYSGSCSPPGERFGLFAGPDLVGVAVFGEAASPKVLEILPCPPDQALVLGRLVLLQQVRANAESWFVAQCFEHLRRAGYGGIITYADPESRTTLAGRVVFGGHAGTIYQALSAAYTGRGSPDTQYLLPDGRVFEKRAASKIRKREEGWRYAVDLLVGAGAVPPTSCEDMRAWLKRERAMVTRSRRHPGCFRYLFPIDRSTRRHLQAHLERREVQVLPYPKLVARPPT